MKNNKQVVAGLGEIGDPILKALSREHITVGYDTNNKLIDHKKIEKCKNLDTSILHVCIPFNSKFIKNILKKLAS